MAVDTLGHLLAVHVWPANEQERDQVAGRAEAVQEVTGEKVQVAPTLGGRTLLRLAGALPPSGTRL